MPVVDTQAPLLSSSTPSGVQPVNSNITLTFNESVRVGQGNIRIFNLTLNAFRDISVTDGQQVRFSGNTMTIDPSTDLTPGCEIAVYFDSDVVRDMANNPYAGLNFNQLNFITTGTRPDVGPISVASPVGNIDTVTQGYNTTYSHGPSAQPPRTDPNAIWAIDFGTTGNAMAVANGTVARRIDNDPTFGNFVTIEYNVRGRRFYGTYAHLASITTGLQAGSPVTTAQTVGVIGNTGSGAGGSTHLHAQFGSNRSGGGTGNVADGRNDAYPLIYFQGLTNNAADQVPSSVQDGTRLRATDMIGTSAGDTLNGTISPDRIFGLAGNDIINGGEHHDSLYGGRGNDNLDGGTGNDILYGSSDNDIMNGGAGSDILYGGAGSDTLSGGINADQFYYTAIGDRTGACQDTIQDFSRTEGDRLYFSRSAFNVPLNTTAIAETNNTGMALYSNTRFVFNTANRTLYFDADGSGSGQRVALISMPNYTPRTFVATDIYLVA